MNNDFLNNKMKHLKNNIETFYPMRLIDSFVELSKTLRAYQDAINEMGFVSITDLKGNIIYINENFVEVSGYESHELLHKPHRIINSGYHSKDFFKIMWQTIKKGDPWKGEIKNRSKDGRNYWVEVIIMPVRNEKNIVFQYLSVGNLISSKKKQEEKLVTYEKIFLKSKQQLRDAQEIAKVGSWYFNKSQDYLEWSGETYRIFEIPRGHRASYELFLDAVYPADRDFVDQSWRTALKSGIYELEHRIITSKGIKWVREKARFTFEQGDVMNAIGTVQDITDRKRMEEIINESEFLYKKLFNNSPFAAGILDKKTLAFLEVNETASKLYGYSKEEFLKITGYDLRLQSDHEELENQILQGEYVKDTRIRYHKKKNGELILVEPAITEIYYKGNHAFLITINDVTEKIKMKEAFARASLNAEEKSRSELGRELHDNINQLLAVSMLYISRAAEVSGKGNELLGTGRELIKDAMEEIRLLSSRMVSSNISDMSLKESITALIESLQLTHISFEIEINIEECNLSYGFKINLYRIVQEQFANIIKHAFPTKVSVLLIQLLGKLNLKMYDNGLGFDLNQKSTGIGFSNIRHRAEAYDGTVLIKSKPGKGCLFEVEFNLL